ncbi:hypothetical protein NUSPORA_00756 [Nucleospora cyclopteri]
MKIKLILMKLIYTTIDNYMIELFKKDIERKYYKNFCKEMEFQTDKQKTIHFKNHMLFSKNTHFNHLCKSKNSTLSNERKNINYNQTNQLKLNTENEHHNKFYKKNDKKIYKIVLNQKKHNSEDIKNETPMKNSLEFIGYKNQDKSKNIPQILQKILVIQKKCIDISKYQYILLKERQFDITKFKHTSNKLFFLLKHRICIQKNFNFKNHNALKISKNLNSQPLCILKKQNKKSFKFQYFERYDSTKLSTPNIQPFKTCLNSYPEKNLNQFPLLYYNQPSYIIDKNLSFQGYTKNKSPSETNIITDNIQLNKQNICEQQHINENIIVNELNLNQLHNSWLSNFSKEKTVLNKEKKCDESKLIQNQSTTPKKNYFILQDKCDKPQIKNLESSFNGNKIEENKTKFSKELSSTQTSDKKKNSSKSHIVNSITNTDSSKELLYPFGLSEKEDSNNSDYDSTENDEFESFEPVINEKFSTNFSEPKKCMLAHKKADKIKLFNQNIDFLHLNYMKFKNHEKEIRKFPEGFSFSHGWRKSRLSIRAIYSYESKPLFCLKYVKNMV